MFLQDRDVISQTYSNIMTHVKNKLTLQSVYNEMEVLNRLPLQLANTIRLLRNAKEISEIFLFRFIDNERVKLFLFNRMDPIRWNTGHVVLTKGEHSTGVLIIISGQVELFVPLFESTNQFPIKRKKRRHGIIRKSHASSASGSTILGTRGPGEMLGHGALLKGKPHEMSAFVVAPIKGYFLSQVAIDQMLKHHPVIALYLQNAFAKVILKSKIKGRIHRQATFRSEFMDVLANEYRSTILDQGTAITDVIGVSRTTSVPKNVGISLKNQFLSAANIRRGPLSSSIASNRDEFKAAVNSPVTAPRPTVRSQKASYTDLDVNVNRRLKTSSSFGLLCDSVPFYRGSSVSIISDARRNCTLNSKISSKDGPFSIPNAIPIGACVDSLPFHPDKATLPPLPVSDRWPPVTNGGDVAVPSTPPPSTERYSGRGSDDGLGDVSGDSNGSLCNVRSDCQYEALSNESLRLISLSHGADVESVVSGKRSPPLASTQQIQSLIVPHASLPPHLSKSLNTKQKAGISSGDQYGTHSSRGYPSSLVFTEDPLSEVKQRDLAPVPVTFPSAIPNTLKAKSTQKDMMTLAASCGEEVSDLSFESIFPTPTGNSSAEPMHTFSHENSGIDEVSCRVSRRQQLLGEISPARKQISLESSSLSVLTSDSNDSAKNDIRVSHRRSASSMGGKRSDSDNKLSIAPKTSFLSNKTILPHRSKLNHQSSFFGIVPGQRTGKGLRGKKKFLTLFLRLENDESPSLCAAEVPSAKRFMVDMRRAVSLPSLYQGENFTADKHCGQHNGQLTKCKSLPRLYHDNEHRPHLALT